MSMLRRHWPWLLAFVILLALPFLMMVLILVFRPRGLMGTRDT
jgi:branched-subunit amino acid ABC-type transport system permease component